MLQIIFSYSYVIGIEKKKYIQQSIIDIVKNYIQIKMPDIACIIV